MYSINLHFRPSTRRGRTDGKLFLRLIYARQSGNITLPYRIDVSEWNAESQNVIWTDSTPGRMRYLMELHDVLNRERETFRLFVDEYDRNELVNVSDIIAAYRCKSFQGGLSSFVDSVIKELICEKRDRTARAYQTAWRRILLYSGKDDLSVSDFTDGFVRGFEKVLQAEKCSLNTISFYMRNLRAIYNKGKEKGIFPRDMQHPFRQVYTKIAPTRKRALSKEDVRRLNCLNAGLTAPLSREEEDALHLFLFSFHACGMSFVDLAYLRKTDIRGQILSYYRKKTGRLIQIRITDGMQRSIDYFSERMRNSPYVFPIILDKNKPPYTQYCTGLRLQNQRLKMLKNRLGLKKGLSTHMARHSWATIARSESISVDVISEALGHSFVATTYIYLESFGSNVIGQATQKVSKAVNGISEKI